MCVCAHACSKNWGPVTDPETPERLVGDAPASFMLDLLPTLASLWAPHPHPDHWLQSSLNFPCSPASASPETKPSMKTSQQKNPLQRWAVGSRQAVGTGKHTWFGGVADTVQGIFSKLF